MSEIVPHILWEQRVEESDAEYAWFKIFLELGESRTIPRAAKRLGLSTQLCNQTALNHDWRNRTRSYDIAVKDFASTLIADESEALAAQYAAGMMMLHMGVTALKHKNPSLLKMKDIREMLQFGSEMARRGAGVADLKVDHTTTKRVDDMFAALLGEEVDDDG